MTAKCYKCKQDLPVEDFARDKSKSSGRKSICKACDNEKAKRYYADNLDLDGPSKRRGRVRERVYAQRWRREGL
jgi:uncharacterized CHY-type Zn-finger protein